MTMRMKMTVFWVPAAYSLLEVYQRFRGTCSLHHQGNHPEDRKQLSLKYMLTLLHITATRTIHKHSSRFLKILSLHYCHTESAGFLLEIQLL